MKIITGKTAKRTCKRCKSHIECHLLKCPHCGAQRPTEY